MPCRACQYGMAAIERFCPKCGTPRAGIDATAAPKSPWQKVLDRLKAATAGRYEVLQELGRGGMAAVYLAHEVALDRKVAIKVMRPDLMLDEVMVERFMREARTMAAFQHPNIVTVHAVESADELHYFVMQYVPGMALDRIIRSVGQLPVAAMQSVIFQAANALAYAHRAGVIHRDIKPANILIDQRGNAIVTDFGIAKVADLSTTATSSQMGTPQYMSPEQCNGTALTPASDQYALGNVAYEMLVGEPPFRRDAAIALAVAITTEKPRPIDVHRKDCPRDIGEGVLRMLAKEPARRWPSLAEAAAAIGGDHLADEDPVRDYLATLAKAEAPSPGSSALTPRAPRTSTGALFTRAIRRQRMTQLVVPIAVVVIGISTGVFAYWRSTVNRAAPVARDSVPAAGADTATPPQVAVVPPPVPPPATRSMPPPAPAPAPNQQRPVPPPVVRPERPETVVVTRDVLVPDTSGRMAPPPPPPPPPPAAVSRAAEIRQAVSRYAAAINARNMNQLKTIFPALPGAQEARWRDLFSNEIEELSATTTVRNIDERGDAAEASFLLTLVFKPRRDQPQTARIGSVASLRFQNGAWVIVALQTSAE